MTTSHGDGRAPYLLALDQHPETLRVLQDRLQRYMIDYRVECFGDPTVAQLRLKELATTGEEVARLLAERSDSVAARVGFSNSYVNSTRMRSARCWFLGASGQMRRAPTRSAP